jgi:hypothetical protein
LAWKRRKTVRGSSPKSAGAAQSGDRLTKKQRAKIALYLKYLAFIIESGTAE